MNDPTTADLSDNVTHFFVKIASKFSSYYKKYFTFSFSEYIFRKHLFFYFVAAY
jgi:hypothetical protein